MKTIVPKIMLAATFAVAAFAQSTSPKDKSSAMNVYVFGAPGGVTGPAKTRGTFQAGAGVEVALPKRFGAGVEAGAISPWVSWGESTLGFLSANGYFHFRRDHRLDPFVTAGYTNFFRDGHLNLFNFGGGVNLWATRRLGAKIELRDQVETSYGTLHYWNFRLGLAFR